VGARRPDQIEETAGAADKALLPETVQAIENLLDKRNRTLAAH
jgi:hypothetical protein